MIGPGILLSPVAVQSGAGGVSGVRASCIEAAFHSGRLRRALRVDALPEGLREELMRKGVDG